jgi:hypothetical protein
MKKSEDIRSVTRSGTSMVGVSRVGVGTNGVIGVPLGKPAVTNQIYYAANPLTFGTNNLIFS